MEGMEGMESTVETSLDSVGDGIDSLNAPWSFGGNTPKKFDSHVSKSVPKYKDGHDIILSLSDFFINKQSTVYELGSSTGSLTRKLAERHPHGSKFIGIDIEEAMTQQATSQLTAHPAHKNITFLTDDILNFPYEKVTLSSPTTPCSLSRLGCVSSSLIISIRALIGAELLYYLKRCAVLMPVFRTSSAACTSTTSLSKAMPPTSSWRSLVRCKACWNPSRPPEIWTCSIVPDLLM